MKGIKLFISLMGISLTTLFSQSNGDSLKNEFQFHLSPLFSNYANEFSVKLGYARRFPNNHFLRTGVHIIPALRQKFNRVDGLNTNEGPDTWSPGDVMSYNDEVSIGETYGKTFRGSIYVGYDHLFGKRSTRFLLGVDILAGIAHHQGNSDIKYYDATFIADTVSMQYNPSLTYTESYVSDFEVAYFYFGFSPRIGMRSDISKRLAISIIYSPQFIVDTKSPWLGFPGNNVTLATLGVPFSLDVGLHVKL